MTQAAPFPAPDTPGRRPGTVTATVALLYFAAALEVVNAVAAVASYGAFQEGYEKAYGGTSLSSQAAGATTQVIAQIVIAFVLGAIFVTLAVLDGKGSRVGRILTFVFAGVALCCDAGLLLAGPLGEKAYDANLEKDPSLPTYDQVQDTIASSLPGWYTPVTMTAAIVVLVAFLLAVVLLLLPASRGYFRKRTEPEWEPPVPSSPMGFPPSGH
jgi:hypothetical protein